MNGLIHIKDGGSYFYVLMYEVMFHLNGENSRLKCDIWYVERLVSITIRHDYVLIVLDDYMMILR